MTLFLFLPYTQTITINNMTPMQNVILKSGVKGYAKKLQAVKRRSSLSREIVQPLHTALSPLNRDISVSAALGTHFSALKLSSSPRQRLLRSFKREYSLPLLVLDERKVASDTNSKNSTILVEEQQQQQQQKSHPQQLLECSKYELNSNAWGHFIETGENDENVSCHTI